MPVACSTSKHARPSNGGTREGGRARRLLTDALTSAPRRRRSSWPAERKDRHSIQRPHGCSSMSDATIAPRRLWRSWAMEISGKTAIVTGAASGIGLGIATALAEAGANVVMADIQKDAVQQAAHQLSGTNKQVLPVRIDVTQEQSVIDALAEAERRFGKLHIACNNAGVPMHGTRLVDVSVADWAFVMGVNVWGVIHGIRHFVPAILEARRSRAHRQHRLSRRHAEPPRH